MAIGIEAKELIDLEQYRQRELDKVSSVKGGSRVNDSGCRAS
jgi:hypothetical protein